MLYRQRLFVSCVALAATVITGCGREDTSVEAPTPSVRMPSRTLRDPLTEGEIRTFLAVLADLPDGQVPQFEPLSQITASEKMTAAQLADIYRQEYRAMFDASRHGQRWRNDAELMATLRRHGTEPEDFAALMMRMSIAITANTLSSRVNLTEAAAKADGQIVDLIRRIDRLDAGSRTPGSIDQRRQTLESLQDFVAFSEFSRMLMDVPAESCAVIARHRAELARHLPSAGNTKMFERTIESEVVPTSFEQLPTVR